MEEWEKKPKYVRKNKKSKKDVEFEKWQTQVREERKLEKPKSRVKNKENQALH